MKITKFDNTGPVREVLFRNKYKVVVGVENRDNANFDITSFYLQDRREAMNLVLLLETVRYESCHIPTVREILERNNIPFSDVVLHNNLLLFYGSDFNIIKSIEVFFYDFSGLQNVIEFKTNYDHDAIQPDTTTF